MRAAHSPGEVRAVDGVSFDVRRGQTLGIAGESGSGKSLLSRSIMRIAPGSAEVTGRVLLNGTDLLSVPRNRLGSFLGPQIAMVFQDPMTALNPTLPIERQLTEAPRRHLGLSATKARTRALELLEVVGIPEPRKRMTQYPHQLSGGMRQRVMIAIALACDPDVLIADEATTALDVTVQRQILDLLQKIQRERQMSVLMVSHDLGVLAARADRIMVMYGGRVMETASTRDLFRGRRHRYTDALRAIPRLDTPRHGMLTAIPGSPPDAATPMAGCRFAPRCEAAQDDCRNKRPDEQDVAAERGHRFTCYHPIASRKPQAAAAEGSA
ncbi:ABC transporter ATP-binding protein [Microbacterium elymi]|uniref:ABC transporter ATP-binding protein n=1 Tax=Microbacterium elymi TaxID=2909587 RepID=A0ABY5NHQ0_9MICO|nr:ABC transporter ATP-binding protein [Microbacterium elymi]UUT34695.1 ABC transporter ATP-binding protein [Microbacterium elymi]